MTRNTVTVSDQELIIEPRGFDKIFSFTNRITVPITSVRGATHDPGMRHEPKGIRGPGLGLPGKLSGTFHREGRKQFWNISGYERAVVITLDDEQNFDQIVISVDDPEAVVAAINRAAGAATE